MEDTYLELIKNPPICNKCQKPMRFVGEKKLMDNMEKGLSASLTLSDKTLLRLYVCESCRRVEFYMP